MKKTLLFAILAFSINAFAQINQPISNSHKATLNAKESAFKSLMDMGLKLPGMYSEKLLGQTVGFQKPEPVEMVQIMDSSYQWHWDVTGNQWKVYFKHVNPVYDNSNNITSDLGQKWTGSVWEDSTQNTYTYYADNIPKSATSKSWDGSVWTNSAQINYTYDINNNQTGIIWLEWNGAGWSNYIKFSWIYDANNNLTSDSLHSGSGNTWENFSSSSYTYDANNNQIGELDIDWIGGAWENTSKYTWTYNAGNQLTSELIQIWAGSDWENFTKSTYTYDANNNLANELLQEWALADWLDVEKISYSYDANNNLILEFNLGWNGSEFINASQRFYTYDAHFNLTSNLLQYWDGSNWLNNSQFIYSFDEYNFQTGGSSKYWDAYGTGEIYGGDSTHYYFHTIATAIPAFTQTGVSVYPNPGNGKFTVSSNNNLNNVEIYNLAGKRIYAEYNASQTTSRVIDISGYAKGVYFIKVLNGAKIYTQKVIVH